MDLNYILYRHQLSLNASAIAHHPAARKAHRELAHGYARRIRAFQQAHGAAASLVRGA